MCLWSRVRGLLWVRVFLRRDLCAAECPSLSATTIAAARSTPATTIAPLPAIFAAASLASISAAIAAASSAISPALTLASTIAACPVCRAHGRFHGLGCILGRPQEPGFRFSLGY